jgi:hypothetical protein
VTAPGSPGSARFFLGRKAPGFPFPRGAFCFPGRGARWLASLVLAGSALWAQSATVSELLATPRKQLESADFRATGHLVRVQPGGARLNYPITIKAHWFSGVLREMVEVGVAPKPAGKAAPGAGVATHALFEFRPNGQTTIWIAHPGDKSPAVLPFDKWSDGPLGPGFSYEDFLEQQYFWPGQTSEGMAKFGARDCEIVKSTPGTADRTHYANVKSWFDPTIGYPVYAEKTMKETGAVKEFTSYGLRHEEGRWVAHQIEATTRGQAGSTLLIFDRGSAKANLGINDFSPAQLVRF